MKQLFAFLLFATLAFPQEVRPGKPIADCNGTTITTNCHVKAGADGMVSVMYTLLGPRTIGAGANQIPAAAAGNSGYITIVTDSADCVTSGTGPMLCRSNGSAWAPIGGGGSSVSGAYNPRGAYASGTTYAALDWVNYNGMAYASAQSANTGHQPDTSPTWWVVTGPQGAAGAAGGAGADGTSVTATVESAGSNCAAGGVKFVSASGTNYACNGASGSNGTNGTNGTNGSAGAAGTSVTVTAESAGANCTYGGEKLVAASGTSYVCNGAPGSGSGTVTNTAGALTSTHLVLGAGGADTKISDCTQSADGTALTCPGGFASTGPYASSGATQAKPTAPASGSLLGWFDSMALIPQWEDSTGTLVANAVVPKAARTAHQFITNVPSTGVQATAAIDISDLPTITVPYGGTGLTTQTAHAIYAGNTTSAPTAIGPDASTTKALFSAGASADPAFRAIAAGDLPAAPVTVNTGSDPCPTGTHCAFSTTLKAGYVFNQQTATDRIYIDLPTAAAGLQWCIKNSVVGGTGAAVTGIITVKAQTGDYINNNGTIGSSGGVLSSAGAAGDGACFVSSNTNHWEAFIGKGTWLP